MEACNFVKRCLNLFATGTFPIILSLHQHLQIQEKRENGEDHIKGVKFKKIWRGYENRTGSAHTNYNSLPSSQIWIMYVLKNSIICARLLTPKSQKQRSLINNYVSNFVNALKFNSFDKMKYFDIYTNAALELSKDKTFYEAWRINFYPSK